MPSADTAIWAGIALVLLLLPGLLVRLLRRREKPRPKAVVDGSNVMFWKDRTPQIATVRAVVQTLIAQGYETAVIFDANVGYRIGDSYLNDFELGHLLGLPAQQVMVVPKGEQADPWLLNHAQVTGAIIVSNDRFRDRIGDYPGLAAPGRLVRGTWQGGPDGGLPRLDLPKV